MNRNTSCKNDEGTCPAASDDISDDQGASDDTGDDQSRV